MTLEAKLLEALMFCHELAVEFLEDYISELEVRVKTKDPSGLGWEYAAQQLEHERAILRRLKKIDDEFLSELNKN